MANSQQRQMKCSVWFQSHIVFSELSQGQAVLCQFNPPQSTYSSLYRIKGSISTHSFSVTYPDLQGLRSKPTPTPAPPSSKLSAQVKNSEPVNECASDVSLIPFTVVPSHHLEGGFYQQPRLLVGQGCNTVQSNLSLCQYVRTPSFLFIMLIASAKLLWLHSIWLIVLGVCPRTMRQGWWIIE